LELDPIRVAMLGSFPPQAQGVQDYCREVGTALGQRCHLHAIGFRRMYPAALFPGVKAAMDPTKAPMIAPGLTVEHRLTWHNPLGWLRAGLATPCDVFHAQWWSLPLFPVTWTILRAMKRRGKPIVVTAHNVLPHERSRAYITASHRLFRLANRVLVHSESNLEQLRAQYGLSEAKTLQVPMGVSLAGAPRVAPAEARAQLGLPDGPRYVLSFGNIRPYKGVDTLLHALARLPQEVHVIIAGKPWSDWAPYARIIEEHGLAPRVHTFLDYIPESRVPVFFGAADVVALPYTHFDAQSAVGALALPYRKPMVVSRTGALPDWVENDPTWIVPPGDDGALADRLAALFAQWPAHCQAFDALAGRVLDATTWNAIAARLLAIYHDCQG
jgi:glycosyltransferase involved in cell wall biosynthesis